MVEAVIPVEPKLWGKDQSPFLGSVELVSLEGEINTCMFSYLSVFPLMTLDMGKFIEVHSRIRKLAFWQEKGRAAEPEIIKNIIEREECEKIIL